MSAFPPFAVVLDGLHTVVVALGDAVEPFAGASSSALAVVLLTLLVRALLVPVGVSQVRAEIGRRRLAPALADLRRRIRDPQALQRATAALYTSEKVSPLAGCLPTLAQAPVLTAVWSLFSHPLIAGHANALLGHGLAGAALGATLVGSVGGGFAVVGPFAVLLVVLAVVVELRRRADLRAAGPAASTTAQEAVPGLATIARVVPFVSVVVAAFVPLAAALYLVTSAAWTLGERALLRRLLA
nr:membrane protein insertase YidC [Frigoribacterium faeni]